MLRAENLNVTYVSRRRTIHALSDVGIEVGPGQLLAVVGPSGSGKSTLLNVLGTLLAPTAGQVWLDGQSVYGLPHARRRQLRRRWIGFLFQTFHLVPYLTAAENVRIALALRGRTRRQAEAEAGELLDRVGLGDRGDHVIDDLSIGERQRVALARAIAGRPPVLLADEPTGNLDPENAALVFNHLREYVNGGAVAVVVTHDPQAAGAADRTLTLRGGRLVEESLNGACKGEDG